MGLRKNAVLATTERYVPATACPPSPPPPLREPIPRFRTSLCTHQGGENGLFSIIAPML